MLNVYSKIWKLFNQHEKKRALLLLLLMNIMAISEVLGVGSIMPFLSVLGNQETIHTNQYLFYMYTLFDFKSNESFLIFLGFLALVILLISAFVRTLSYYALFRFSNMRRHSIGQKLLKKYLHQPYKFFLNRNSSDVTKTILSETDSLIEQVIVPAIRLVTYSILTGFLVIFLLIIDPVLALILALIFGVFYSIMYLTVRKYLGKIGKERVKANSSRFKVVLETIGGIKDLKVLGREKVYLDSFTKPSSDFSMYSATSKTLSQAPQFLMEAIAFGSLLVMAIYGLSSEGFDLGEFLPVLGLYALGVLKLKPAINEIYKSLSTMKFGNSGLDNVLEDLENLTNEKSNILNDNKRLLLKESLVLKNVNFSYDNSSKLALENININIKVNTTVGIIGTTGAGKSTLVDIILGLLHPNSGQIIVDDNILDINNIRQWQNSIGYVPQSIFLIDDSIASNIAFGVPKEEIDMKQVEEVAKMAKVYDFVISLENGFDTEIGERGVRLSGGQRQRLGIARALYHNPELLVLDEATSALDNETEAEVMKAIDGMSGSKTIIMIAHRLSTVERCDMLIKIQNGKIV